MKWEQRIIAISLALVVILVVLQTLAIFGAADGTFVDYIERWQTLVAAVVAVVGIAWQISRQGDLARRQMRHSWSLFRAQITESRFSFARSILPDVEHAFWSIQSNRAAFDVLVEADMPEIYEEAIRMLWCRTNVRRLAMNEARLGEIPNLGVPLIALLDVCRRIDRRIVYGYNGPKNPPPEVVHAQMEIDKLDLEDAYSNCLEVVAKFDAMFGGEDSSVEAFLSRGQIHFNSARASALEMVADARAKCTAQPKD